MKAVAFSVAGQCVSICRDGKGCICHSLFVARFDCKILEIRLYLSLAVAFVLINGQDVCYV